MPKLSVIVPAYNVAEYIEDCISIILKQDYGDYEVIIIDDGSTDKTKQLCDEFTDPHVKVIHKENGGLSDARNTGILNANGDYLVFLDSDDFWIYSNTLSILAEIIDKHHPDCIVFDHLTCTNKEETGYGEILSTVPSVEHDINGLIGKRKFKACSWDKIINRKVIESNTMTFPVGKLAEDIFWCGDILEFCQSIIYVDLKLYAYRMRGSSITHDETRKKKRFTARIEESARCYQNHTKQSVKKYAALDSQT